MVKLTLYGNKKATCTQRVLILLEELQLKYDFVDVDLTNAEQKSKEFLKLNPFGKIPAMQYDDHIIFESRAILRYILQNNDENYMPVDVDVWLEAESQNFNPHISKIVYEKMFKKMKNESPNELVIEKELELFKKVLDVYEQRLETVKYIAGDYYSIADMSHIPYLNYFIKCGYKDLLKTYPNVYKWVKRLLNKETVQYVLHKE